MCYAPLCGPSNLIAMNKLLIPTLTTLALTFGACTSEQPTDQAEPNTPAQNEPAQNESSAVLGPAVYDVKCGCSIDGIGKCGNYVMIEGKYVPLIHGSLGKMEFCSFKDKGAKIKAVGTMQEGKYVAREWKMAQ